MAINRMDPDERMASAFASVVGAFDRLFSPLDLTGEQAEELRADLFLWFDRFCRRPGQGNPPIRSLQLALVWSAWKVAAELWALRNHGVAIFPRDPEEIARELGIMPDGPAMREPPR